MVNEVVNNFDRIESYNSEIPELVAGVWATARAFDSEFAAAQVSAVRRLQTERSDSLAYAERFPGHDLLLGDYAENIIKETLEGVVAEGGDFAVGEHDKAVTYENGGPDEWRGLHRELEQFYGREDFLANWALDMARFIDLLSEIGWPMAVSIYVSDGDAWISAWPQPEAASDDASPNVFEIDLEEPRRRAQADYGLEGEELEDYIAETESNYINIRISPRCVIEDGCSATDIIRLRELLSGKSGIEVTTTKEPVLNPPVA